jgi:hypothetical protein
MVNYRKNLQALHRKSLYILPRNFADSYAFDRNLVIRVNR